MAGLPPKAAAGLEWASEAAFDPKRPSEVQRNEEIKLESDRLNRWLTLGAHVGVLVGIFLLIAELNQNSTLMRAQIFNDRAGHGIALFTSISESPELSEIDGLLAESGFPGNSDLYSKLTRTQKSRYLWLMRADRFRIENLLYQMVLGISEPFYGTVFVGHLLIAKYEVFFEDEVSKNILEFRGVGHVNNLKQLVAEVEGMLPEND